METNEIKKLLYKQKPIAKCIGSNKDTKKYETWISLNESNDMYLKFEVPYSDMGETKFSDEIQGQLLIRWLDVNPLVKTLRKKDE